MSEPACNRRCLTAEDIGEWGEEIVEPDPGCPVHGNREENR